MEHNQVLIFPGKNLQAWDRLPRFTFLDYDLKKNPTHEDEVQRKKQPIKPIFVGSPVRSIETGGLLTLSASHKRSKENGEEFDPKSKKK